MLLNFRLILGQQIKFQDVAVVLSEQLHLKRMPTSMRMFYARSQELCFFRWQLYFHAYVYAFNKRFECYYYTHREFALPGKFGPPK